MGVQQKRRPFIRLGIRAGNFIPSVTDCVKLKKNTPKTTICWNKITEYDTQAKLLMREIEQRVT